MKYELADKHVGFRTV